MPGTHWNKSWLAVRCLVCGPCWCSLACQRYLRAVLLRNGTGGCCSRGGRHSGVAVAPGGVLVVEGYAQAAVQDADETVAEGSQGSTMAVAGAGCWS